MVFFLVSRSTSAPFFDAFCCCLSQGKPTSFPQQIAFHRNVISKYNHLFLSSVLGFVFATAIISHSAYWSQCSLCTAVSPPRCCRTQWRRGGVEPSEMEPLSASRAPSPSRVSLFGTERKCRFARATSLRLVRRTFPTGSVRRLATVVSVRTWRTLTRAQFL